MKYSFLIVTLGGLLSACSETSAIEDAVRESLLDPESARFSEITEYTDEDGDQWACVMVNAKNRMGGYTGDSMMLALKTEEHGWQATSGLPGVDCATYLRSRNR